MNKSIVIFIAFTLVISALFFFLLISSQNKRSPEEQELGSQVADENVNDLPIAQDIDEFTIETLEEGEGVESKEGDTLVVDYHGTFVDGTVFDSSYQRGEPFVFTVGTGSVIQGWDIGMLGMKVGEKRRLMIPSDLAYGPDDYSSIPGGSGLIFEVELHEIQ